MEVASVLIWLYLCPIHANIQVQVGRGSDQPDLVEGVPASCRGLD